MDKPEDKKCTNSYGYFSILITALIAFIIIACTQDAEIKELKHQAVMHGCAMRETAEEFTWKDGEK